MTGAQRSRPPDDAAPSAGCRVVFGERGAAAYEELRGEYRATLSAPLDDMWATFADNARPAALMVDADLAGCAAIGDEGEVQHFFVRADFDIEADRLLRTTLHSSRADSVIAPTVDPGLLSVLLPYCRSATPVALMYHHHGKPEGGDVDHLRLALDSDLVATAEFMAATTDMPPDVISRYAANLVDQRELYLLETGGEIIGIGERRVDRRAPGHAHVGIIVGPAHRGRGLGSQLINTLVTICEREALAPLCSTEPDNVAARKVIRRAGFRRRHTVFRVGVDGFG